MFVQANLSTEQLDTIHWIVFDLVGLPNTIKHDLRDFKFGSFQFFGRVLLVRKSNSHKVWCSIWFNCQTQSNSIHGLSSNGFN